MDVSNRIYGYTIVAYPESMPEDWKSRLNALPCGYAYSLHDKDVNDDTGEIKKPHMHFYFQSNLTVKQEKYAQEALGVSYGEKVRSASGMYDYLTHKNNPDKYHYPEDSIAFSEKWDQELFESTCSGIKEYASESDVIKFVEDNNILEYRDYMLLAVESERWDLVNVGVRYWVKSYIDSRRNKYK